MSETLVVSLSVNQLKEIVCTSVRQELKNALPVLETLNNQKQTAKHLGCSTPTLKRYRKLKLLPEIVVGKRVYFRTSDINKLLTTVKK